MKILVIGGNRFFGKRLVAGLIAKEHHVTLMNRGQIPDGFGDRVQRITMDRRELRRNHPALGDQHWDVIVDQVCYDAAEAAGACQAFGGRVGRYVFTSTKSVYGQRPNLRESAFDPKKYPLIKLVTRDDDYGEAKRQAEAAFFQQAPFPVVAVRFPIVIGPDDYTERLKFHVDRVLQSRSMYFPAIEAKMCFISSADAAAFLEFILESTFTGPVNACAMEPIALRKIVDQIETITGKKAILASDSTQGDHSPYGADSDTYMNTDLMRSLGFEAEPIDQWLPLAIRTYAANRRI